MRCFSRVRVFVCVAVWGTMLRAQAPSGGGGPTFIGFEQAVKATVTLERTIDLTKAKVGDPVVAHPRDKVRLLSGFEMGSSATLLGHVVEVEPARGGRAGMLSVAFDSIQPRRGEGRALHATILGMAPAPDYLHPGARMQPLDRTSPGVGVDAGSTGVPASQGALVSQASTFPAERAMGAAAAGGRADGAIFQPNGVRGIDLHANLYGKPSGIFVMRSSDTALPAGTIFSMLLSICPAGAAAP